MVGEAPVDRRAVGVTIHTQRVRDVDALITRTPSSLSTSPRPLPTSLPSDALTPRTSSTRPNVPVSHPTAAATM